jgi:hypothetical protein
MIGFPNIPAKDLKNPVTEVVTEVGAGFVDDSLSGFAAALAKAFEKPHIQRHFDKLARAGADERHLFIPLHMPARSPSVRPRSSCSRKRCRLIHRRCRSP